MIMVRSSRPAKYIDGKLLSSKGYGWVQFDVTSAVKYALFPKFSIKNILLKLSVLQVQRKQEELQFEFAFGEDDVKEPHLVVFTEDKRDAQPPTQPTFMRDKPTFGTEENFSNKKDSDIRERVKRSVKCRRENMFADLENLFRRKFVIRPLNLEVYKCSGTCSLYNPSTFHALVQAHVSELMPAGAKAHPPCCAPRELESKRLLIVDQHNVKNSILKLFPDVVVKKCGCL